MSGEAAPRPEWIIPHSDHGDPDCCGLILPENRGELTDIRCNECGKIFASVPEFAARRLLDAMELSGDVATAKCPACGAIHLSPGLTTLTAFICPACGESVEVRPDLTWAEFRDEDPEWGVRTGISTLCRDEKHKDCIGHGKHEEFTVFCVCWCHRVAGFPEPPPS